MLCYETNIYQFWEILGWFITKRMLPDKCILRSKQVMFWASQLRNLLILSNQTGAKRPSQRSESASWLLSYGIAKDSIIGSVFSSMPWPWGIDTLIPAGCPAENMFIPADCVAAGVLWEGENLEDEDNAINASNASLLRGFMYSLVKKESTQRIHCHRGVRKWLYACRDWSVLIRDSQTTLLFGLL